LLYELHTPEDEDIVVFELLVAIYQVARCNIPQDTMEWLRKKNTRGFTVSTRDEKWTQGC